MKRGRLDGHVGFCARSGLLAREPGRSPLGLGRAVRGFDYGRAPLQIGGCFTNARA